MTVRPRVTTSGEPSIRVMPLASSISAKVTPVTSIGSVWAGGDIWAVVGAAHHAPTASAIVRPARPAPLLSHIDADVPLQLRVCQLQIGGQPIGTHGQTLLAENDGTDRFDQLRLHVPDDLSRVDRPTRRAPRVHPVYQPALARLD